MSIQVHLWRLSWKIWVWHFSEQKGDRRACSWLMHWQRPRSKRMAAKSRCTEWNYPPQARSVLHIREGSNRILEIAAKKNSEKMGKKSESLHSTPTQWQLHKVSFSCFQEKNLKKFERDFSKKKVLCDAVEVWKFFFGKDNRWALIWWDFRPAQSSRRKATRTSFFCEKAD